ncbi:MAG: hypothetical protein PVI90_03110 [Desulfobacteraceae bacterium]|jgi:hypothetical protein
MSSFSIWFEERMKKTLNQKPIPKPKRGYIYATMGKVRRFSRWLDPVALSDNATVVVYKDGRVTDTAGFTIFESGFGEGYQALNIEKAWKKYWKF